MTARDVKQLEAALGHRFENRDLLVTALTHASALSNAPGQDGGTYQRLEFLGDRVLGLVVADMLDVHFPKAPEGELSRRLARLVSGETCAEVAGEIAVGRPAEPGVPEEGGAVVGGIAGDVAAEVLEQHRDAAERSVGQLTGRLAAGLVEPVAQHGVQLRVHPLDPLDGVLDELRGARLPAPDELGLRGGVQPCGVGHAHAR